LVRSNPVAGITRQNVVHFKRYKNPPYRKNAIAAWQAFWTQIGVSAAGPRRRSQITSAAPKNAGHENIQLSSPPL
jgi:hypothetical protein